jgi:hypothetical protein
LNHDYFPGAYSLNDLKLNVDSINTNIGTINSNLSSLQIYLNSPPATFNIYIYDSDMYGNIYLSGNDRSGSFAYWILSDISQKKILINVNDGDTVNIFLSETVIAFTNLPGMVDIAVLITFSGVQMSFGGHHAKKASDQLQKKLQEEAMADGADNLADNLAGMDMKDNMSIGSSNAETQFDLLRAQIRQLQSQNNNLVMATTTLSQQLAETAAAVSPEQMKHNAIICNHMFVSAISAMQGPDLDIDTLWWMVQWGNEYLARFKRDGTKAQKTAHAAYKKWTADTKQKQMAGFTASLRSAAGADDSLNQSLE